MIIRLLLNTKQVIDLTCQIQTGSLGKEPPAPRYGRIGADGRFHHLEKHPARRLQGGVNVRERPPSPLPHQQSRCKNHSQLWERISRYCTTSSGARCLPTRLTDELLSLRYSHHCLLVNILIYIGERRYRIEERRWNSITLSADSPQVHSSGILTTLNPIYLKGVSPLNCPSHLGSATHFLRAIMANRFLVCSGSPAHAATYTPASSSVASRDCHFGNFADVQQIEGMVECGHRTFVWVCFRLGCKCWIETEKSKWGEGSGETVKDPFGDARDDGTWSRSYAGESCCQESGNNFSERNFPSMRFKLFHGWTPTSSILRDRETRVRCLTWVPR